MLANVRECSTDTMRVGPPNSLLTVRHYCLTMQFMGKLKVTAKGQVTLKKDLLNHLGVSPGEKIDADKLPDGRIVVRAATREGDIKAFIGCLAKKTRRKLTIEEISRKAAEGWAGEK